MIEKTETKGYHCMYSRCYEAIIHSIDRMLGPSDHLYSPPIQTHIFPTTHTTTINMVMYNNHLANTEMPQNHKYLIVQGESLALFTTLSDRSRKIPRTQQHALHRPYTRLDPFDLILRLCPGCAIQVITAHAERLGRIRQIM